MDKIKVYNLTCFNQHIQDPDLEIEVPPRLYLPADPHDWDEMKTIVTRAVINIPKGAHVLVGDFGPYVALIHDLNEFRLLFTVYDPAQPRDRRVVGVTAFRGFTPGERYSIGLARFHNGNG